MTPIKNNGVIGTGPISMIEISKSTKTQRKRIIYYRIKVN